MPKMDPRAARRIGVILAQSWPRGTGSGVYTILIYAVIAVFIGGLMIGRTPEYLGKKIQAREVKLAGLGALVMPKTHPAQWGFLVSKYIVVLDLNQGLARLK
jgi:K+-transporting ATPase A subunit